MASISMESGVAPAAPHSILDIEHLNALIHSAEDLQRAGYILGDYTDDKLIQKKLRCARCFMRIKNTKQTCEPAEQHASPKESASEPKTMKCILHTGRVHSHQGVKVWTCCRQRAGSPGCAQYEQHVTRSVTAEALRSRYGLFSTPSSPLPATNFRSAVVIDCEMGTAFDGDTELIRVSAVDYFTSEVLVDKLVFPQIMMKHLNTRYSGVTWAQLRAARSTGKCFNSVAEAREALWKYVGRDTIVVGHSTSCDLRALRWIHPVIIDSLLVEQKLREAQEEEVKITEHFDGWQDPLRHTVAVPAQAVDGKRGDSRAADQIDDNEGKKNDNQGSFRTRGSLSLQQLTQSRLGRQIQQGRHGHDSLEDAIATKDLVQWHVERRKAAADI